MFEDDLLVAQKLFDKYQRPTVENIREEMYSIYINDSLIKKIADRRTKDNKQLFKNANNLKSLDPEKIKNTIERFLKLNDLEKQRFFNISGKIKIGIYKELFSAKDTYIEFEKFNLIRSE